MFSCTVNEECAVEARRLAEEMRKHAIDNFRWAFRWGNDVELFKMLEHVADGNYTSPEQAFDITRALKTIRMEMDKHEELYTQSFHHDFLGFYDYYYPEIDFVTKQAEQAAPAYAALKKKESKTPEWKR